MADISNVFDRSPMFTAASRQIVGKPTPTPSAEADQCWLHRF
jgi:hypothetical protein